MKRHADAETLAAFREELLSRRKAARVSAHLAACSRCAGLDAQLTEVSALLTTSTTPPMPDALTARIEAAIAAEAAARAATAADGTVPAGTAGTGTGSRDRAGRPTRPPGRARLVLRVAVVTAAVVVVAGGGYGVARLLTANPESSTSAGPGSAAAPAFGISGNASRNATGGLRAPGTTGNPAPAARIISSDTNYQPGQLESQVSAVLNQHGASASAATGPGPSPANQPAASVPLVPHCVAHVTGGKPPLLVDLAKYQGRPATIIVVPGATHGTLRVLVVAGTCTATTGRVIATTTFPGSG